jgi:hypothetical protein
MGNLGYSTYSSVTNTGGVPGQVTKINADGSTDTFGGGSAKPSAEASIATSGTQCITATVAVVPGATAYAWYTGTATGVLYLSGITPSNQAIFTVNAAATKQPIGNLKVGAVYTDNSTDVLVPDGILPQIYGAILGPDPGRFMATNQIIPTGVSLSSGGSLLYNMPTGNTGLTISGTNFTELDTVLRTAYDQYKIGFDRMLISAADDFDTFGAMLGQNSATTPFRMLFDADETSGRIVAGRKVTSYFNKAFSNTLDVEVHPYVPQGTIILWSDKTPYEVSGVANLLEAHVRQDYYQIQWPWRSRRYEYGVYVDEVFSMYFSPAFAVITNLNPRTGTMVFGA